jgi:hypothetical protein
MIIWEPFFDEKPPCLGGGYFSVAFASRLFIDTILLLVPELSHFKPTLQIVRTINSIEHKAQHGNE